MISEEIVTLLVNTPDDFRKFWRPSDLAKAYRGLFERLRNDGNHSEVLLRYGEFSIVKKLTEEVLPLLKLGDWLQGDDPDRTVEVMPLLKKNDEPDAVLKIDGREESLEITLDFSTVDGRRDALVRKAFSEFHNIPATDADSRAQKVREANCTASETGALVLEEERRIVGNAISAGVKKQGIAYPAGTSLLIWIDDTNVGALSPEMREELRVGLVNITSRFSRVYAMGFGTCPIIVEASNKQS